MRGPIGALAGPARGPPARGVRNHQILETLLQLHQLLFGPPVIGGSGPWGRPALLPHQLALAVNTPPRLLGGADVQLVLCMLCRLFVALLLQSPGLLPQRHALLNLLQVILQLPLSLKKVILGAALQRWQPSDVGASAAAMLRKAACHLRVGWSWRWSSPGGGDVWEPIVNDHCFECKQEDFRPQEVPGINKLIEAKSKSAHIP
mmetsp:Transcript_52070/g.86805  ORF Transcript_52070/g.86805 Transcript_52070/m.86805 type:complete len:204 (-) Transcript_52070:27-638(-)